MRAVVAILSLGLLGAAQGGCSPRPAAAPAATLAEAESSPQAAVAVVRDYYRLVEAGRLSEAAELREDGLQEDVAPFLSLQADVGRPQRLVTRPGFVYATAPVALTGRFVTGGDYRAAGRVILRRSSDLDHAGPRARRWRIHRVEVKG